MRWCALVFVSGFLIVALQIVWYRLVGVVLQSNAYAFSLVLGVFLVGDALGLLHGARAIARIADPRDFFFRMQAGAALLAVVGILLVWILVTWGVLPDDFVDRDIVSAFAAQYPQRHVCKSAGQHLARVHPPANDAVAHGEIAVMVDGHACGGGHGLESRNRVEPLA